LIWFKEWADEASSCTWQEFMGYMSAIISSSLGVNKHWMDSDFEYVIVTVTHDIGKWAIRKWDDFRVSEYQ
jgi:hypothetical protein